MQDLKQLYTAVLEGDARLAKSVTEQALAAGVDPQTLVTEQMIPAMAEAGRRFECNDYFVPELLMNTVSIKEDLDPLIGFDGTWNNNLITRIEYGKSKFEE